MLVMQAFYTTTVFCIILEKCYITTVVYQHPGILIFNCKLLISRADKIYFCLKNAFVFLYFVVTQVVCQTKTQFCHSQKVANSQLMQYNTFLQQQQINKVSSKVLPLALLPLLKPRSNICHIRIIYTYIAHKRKYRNTSLKTYFRLVQYSQQHGFLDGSSYYWA